MMKPVLVSLVAAVVSAAAPDAVRAADAAITASREVVLRTPGPRGGMLLKVQIEKIQPDSNLATLFATSDAYHPTTIIKSFTLQSAGKPVFVPLSAVADLYDLHSVRTAVAPNGYLIDLVGGDGAETYRVRLSIKKGRLATRAMFPGSEASWTQKTEYRDVILD